jgi:hypothetical protein
LPGYWLPKNEHNFFTLLFKHFISKVKHLNIEFDANNFPEPGKIIEKIGISAGEECWYNISVVL